MLARRLPTILPPLGFDEALEATAIHSVAGLIPPGGSLLAERPFRAPHHTASDAALVGGGSHPRPGEVSLAHHGVLFLDEMPEFERRVLDALRQPLEEGRIAVSRAARTVVFPARFMLVAAMNPCPCGYLGHATRACRCTPQQVARYGARLSGPLRDRLDLVVEVEPVPIAALSGGPRSETSAVVRARVLAASRPPDRPAGGASTPAWRRALCTGSAISRTRLEPPARARSAESGCSCRRGRTTACCASRARSPISRTPNASPTPRLPRRCSTGSWPDPAPRSSQLGPGTANKTRIVKHRVVSGSSAKCPVLRSYGFVGSRPIGRASVRLAYRGPEPKYPGSDAVEPLHHRRCRPPFGCRAQIHGRSAAAAVSGDHGAGAAGAHRFWCRLEGQGRGGRYLRDQRGPRTGEQQLPRHHRSAHGSDSGRCRRRFTISAARPPWTRRFRRPWTGCRPS